MFQLLFLLHTQSKVLCSCFLLCYVLSVHAMDYLIASKPLHWTKHLSVNKPPVAWDHTAQRPNPGRPQKPPQHTLHQTTHRPTVSWTGHNNLELNFDMTVCQPELKEAVCMVHHKKKLRKKTKPISVSNHRDITPAALILSAWCYLFWSYIRPHNHQTPKRYSSTYILVVPVV